MIVTDAVAPAGMGPGRYRVSRWDLLIGEDMVARSPDGSHFVGSAITMNQSVMNLMTQLGFTQAQADHATDILPREVLTISP